MRLARLAGHLFFLVYGLMALVFYKERVFFSDSAFQLFKIIHFGTFNIEAGRYSTVFVQILPLLSIKLALPLKAVAIIFSFSYVAIYYLVFLVCIYSLKNDAAAILIPLILIVGIAQSFFHVVTETHQGLVYSVLFYAWLNRNWKTEIRNSIELLVSMLLILLCFYAHPMTFFLVMYVVLIKAISIKKNVNTEPNTVNSKSEIFILSFLLGFIFLIYFLKTYFTDANSYEGNIFGTFRESFADIGKIENFSTSIFIRDYFYGLYYYPACLFLLVFLLFTLKREYSLLTFFLLMTTVFFLTVLFTFRHGESQLMMEKNFMPLMFFIGLPLAEIIVKGRRWILLFYCGYVLLMSFKGIYQSRYTSLGQLQAISKIMHSTDAANKHKIMVNENDSKALDLLDNWSLPFESLLFSSLDGADNSKTIYIKHDDCNITADFGKNLFLGPDFWLTWDTRSFNKNYFLFKEEIYQELN